MKNKLMYILILFFIFISCSEKNPIASFEPEIYEMEKVKAKWISANDETMVQYIFWGDALGDIEVWEDYITVAGTYYYGIPQANNRIYNTVNLKINNPTDKVFIEDNEIRVIVYKMYYPYGNGFKPIEEMIYGKLKRDSL